MPHVLVVYATNHGHTAKVATRIGDGLAACDTTADLRAVESATAVAFDAYDGVIVAGSVHAGHHQRTLVNWVKRHRNPLEALPSGFVSVSLTAAEDSDEARVAAQRYIDDFLDETGLTPRSTTAVAGALQFEEYDFFTRLAVRLIAHRKMGTTDFHHDEVFTDWDAVEHFARDFARLLTPAVAGVVTG
jgi:menaquinone-dependent protoporphyrinogen oxidase